MKLKLTKEEVESYRGSCRFGQNATVALKLCDEHKAMRETLASILEALEFALGCRYSDGSYYEAVIKDRINQLKELLGETS